jgi:cystathionine beta-lyase/cystathionine gamma-synthase
VPSRTAPVVPPLDLSVVYRVASLDDVDAINEGREAGFVYARDGHPNLAQLASKVAALEGAQAAWIGASGMAVESALMLTVLEQGAHVALADGVYGKTGRLALELGRFGVGITRFDATDPGSLQAAVRPETRLVFAETLSNPLLRVADLQALGRIAHASQAHFAVDHTFAPLLCRPIELGADLVVHSITKLIGGHSDVTLGAIAGAERLIARIAVTGSTFGLTGNPFECWLAARGLTTLAVRSRHACASAQLLAERLQVQPEISAVHYPGLAGHPDHERALSLFTGGYGTIVTFELGSRERADALIHALAQSIPFAPSLGDVATTLSHPATTSHRGQAPEEWARQGITPGLIRLSIGLEHPEDLWTELETALRSLRAG